MKRQYRVRNWSEYTAGLKQRGSLIFWVTDEVLEQWLIQDKTGHRGASPTYSDLAIATVATLKSLFHLAGRQAQGLTQSLFKLMQINLPVPDHSTVSRRLGTLSVSMPVQQHTGPRHVVVDSTGIKIYGEGEWKTRQHGVSKRRTWRKLHLGVDEACGEILIAEVTTNDYRDSEILASLLDGIGDEVSQVSGDGADDTFECHEVIAQRGAVAAIPPRRDAQRSQPNENMPTHPRDQILHRIEQVGRKGWKQESGYHRRSLAETMMFRVKVTFGGRVRSRIFDNQAVELFLQCAALNRMIQVAKPDSYAIES
ncbi:MAG: IS5 family transposase [Cyanobacteria bacterium P01_A01_bin.123]